MTNDTDKAIWSKKIGHLADDDAGHVSYWNCWHCKTCESDLIRKCECGKFYDLHSFEEWINCMDTGKEIGQVCPNGCGEIGGLKEYR